MEHETDDEPEDHNEELRIVAGWLIYAGVGALILFFILCFLLFIGFSISWTK